ncbi:MAG TPA: ABC transporter permease, partial [Bacteroidia bacterium]|nr:ABC transporter permease [Bacteroidia bacterium]
MKKNWWKIVTVVLVLYTIIAGFAFNVPAQPILHESIRNLYFHVPMWFAMITICTVSTVQSIIYLSKQTIENDIKAAQ